MNHTALAAAFACVIVAGIGCTNRPPDVGVEQSKLTPGMTKRTITKGVTTQAEIMETFGPPELVTQRDGKEIWTYDKLRQEIQSSSGYFTVLIAGTSQRNVQSSSTSTMLIVYFDAQDRVEEYRLNTVRF
jgi:hypothetical protein